MHRLCILMYFKLSSHLGEGLGVVVETVEADGNDVINPYDAE